MKISQYQVSVIFCFSKIFGETKQTSKGQQQILLSPVLLSRSSSCRCVGAVSFHPTGSQASSNTLISPADPYKQRFTHRLGLCLLFLFFLLVLLDLLGDLGFGLSDQLPQRFAVGHRRHEGVLRRETNRASLTTCKGCWVTGWHLWTCDTHLSCVFNPSEPCTPPLIPSAAPLEPHLPGFGNLLHIIDGGSDDVKLLGYKNLHWRKTAFLYLQAHRDFLRVILASARMRPRRLSSASKRGSDPSANIRWCRKKPCGRQLSCADGSGPDSRWWAGVGRAGHMTRVLKC